MTATDSGLLDRRWLLAATVIVGAFGAFLILFVWVAPGIGYDISLVVDASRRLLSGQPLYADPTGVAFGPEAPNFYGPPALAVAYLPLAPLPDGIVVRFGVILAYAVTALAVGFMLRGLDDVPRRIPPAVAIGVVGSYVFLGGAALGNPSILILPMAALSLLGFRRGSPWMVGLGIGTAAALRLYPIALLVPLLIARRWREAGWVVAVAGAWTAIGAVLGGFDQTREYVSLALAIATVPEPEALSINASLASIAYRLGAPDIVLAIVRLASVGIGVAFLVAAGRWLAAEDEDGARPILAIGLGLAGTLLVAATIWDHYLTALLPLVVGIAVARGQARWALLTVGLIGADVGGGLALLWLPFLAWWLTRRRSPSAEAQTRLVTQ